MANTNQIFGFKPVMLLNGSPYNASGLLCYKAAGTTVTNDTFVGDPVNLTGTGDTKGIPGIVKATFADGNPCFGVIQAVALDPNHLDRATWIDGADAGYVYVCVGKDVIFEVQADDVLTYTDIGQNAIAIQTQAGSRTAGTSGVELDATVATTVTYMFKIVGFPQREDNEINAENNKILVTINNHLLVQDNTGF